jgi:hypothetical protein
MIHQGTGIFEDKVFRLAQLLAIKDGIILTGFFSRNPNWPECGIKHLLKKQPQKDRKKIKRKYRKIKRFIKKKYNIGETNKIRMSDDIKYHYLCRAEKIIKSERQ